MSPSYRARHCTPPRIISTSSDILSYDSPMLTPSPLRQRPLFPNHFTTDLKDAEDLFLQSPYKSPAPAHSSMPQCTVKPQQITADDEEGSIFLASSSSTFSPFFPASPSQPLRTPVKQIFRPSSRSALSIKHLNSLPCPTANVAPSDAMNPATRVGVGTKRKSTPHVQSTPIRQHNLTPLMVASARDTATGGICLDRLAPLAAPKFTPGTPQTNAETDAYLKRQTATLTRLKISDIHDTGEEFAGPDNDSGCEMDEGDAAESLFTGSVRFKGKVGGLGRTSGRGLICSKGKEKEEVAEAISPGGHIIKRRARSRPLSAELIESVQRSPSSPSKVYFKSSSLMFCFSMLYSPGTFHYTSSTQQWNCISVRPSLPQTIPIWILFVRFGISPSQTSCQQCPPASLFAEACFQLDASATTAPHESSGESKLRYFVLWTEYSSTDQFNASLPFKDKYRIVYF